MYKDEKNLIFIEEVWLNHVFFSENLKINVPDGMNGSEYLLRFIECMLDEQKIICEI